MCFFSLLFSINHKSNANGWNATTSQINITKSPKIYMTKSPKIYITKSQKKIPKIRRRPRPGRSPPPPRRHAPPPHRHAPPTLPPRPSAAATRGCQSSRACVQLLCRPTMPLPRCHAPPPRPQGAARAAAAPSEGEESIRRGEGKEEGRRK